ncbi:GNAT family N-acetyltransferase [Aureibaculum sp. 2210JD6-5]|uniref:GNAT family N-acetyltransferase n=1 Tax=Aureibaculum sp. 2210JD6-5 TaxID=3103957 RepID=UPI002AAD4D80|nr:GNAT family N-acetyltransferase [Aureibaculum sp. 2210JD6-5]MDY7394670.1 GNAT family N-acetyltransferase [Aureibaculum sp. 2210JD6-5]
MKWFLKTFNELSLEEFHSILKLRIDIFVVEQNCPYPELDNKDQIAYHCFCKENNDVIAYTRIFKPGDYYNEAAFGRVVVHQNFRKQHLGRELISKTITETYKLFGKTPIKIGGQVYLKKFYESFGFQQVGEEYLEDGIPHVYMVLNK